MCVCVVQPYNLAVMIRSLLINTSAPPGRRYHRAIGMIYTKNLVPKVPNCESPSPQTDQFVFCNFRCYAIQKP